MTPGMIYLLWCPPTPSSALRIYRRGVDLVTALYCLMQPSGTTLCLFSPTFTRYCRCNVLVLLIKWCWLACQVISNVHIYMLTQTVGVVCYREVCLSIYHLGCCQVLFCTSLPHVAITLSMCTITGTIAVHVYILMPWPPPCNILMMQFSIT